MNIDPIFNKFERVRSIAAGERIYDFLGGSTDVAFKKGWARHAIAMGKEVVPGYPPLNEHYFDWIATLQSVDSASNVFRMAELGAGWAPWLVHAGKACRQRKNIVGLELVAVEADLTHFGWVNSHFRSNGFSETDFKVIHGAIAEQRGVVRFPIIENPDENYGASTKAAMVEGQFVQVESYPISDVIKNFSGPLDFLHVDIQGAEYDVLPPYMSELGRNVKAIMVGTHTSSEKHASLASVFLQSGWTQIMNFDRNSTSLTEFGPVDFGDGFLYFRNPAFHR